MGKSKRDRQIEKIDKLSNTYKHWTDEQLLNVRNKHGFIHTQKEYRVAINNELKVRGLKIN